MMNDNDKKVLNLSEIERQFKFLSDYRGLKRIERLKKTSLNLHNTLKSFGYVNIDKGFFNSFFDEIPTTTQNRTLKEVLNFLIEDKKIKPSTKNKIRIRIRQKPLFSYINKNGCSITTSRLSCVKMKDVYKIKSYILL